MNDEIVMTKSDLDTIITEVSNKALEGVNTKLESIEKQVKAPNPFTQIQVKEEKTFPIGRLALATAKSHLERKSIVEVLNEVDDVHAKSAKAFLAKSFQIAGKSLGSISSGGGFSDAMGESEYLAILRPQSVVRQIAGRNITLVGGVGTYNKGNASATAYWLSSDTSTITQSNATFSQVKMYGKKLAALTQISNDSIRMDLRGIEEATQYELLQAIGQEEDLQFLTGAGSAGTPIGLTNLATGSYALTMTSSPTSAKVKKDLLKLVNACGAGNSKLRNAYFVMNTTLKNTILNQTDSNSVEMNYARELSTLGTLFGYKVVTTNNMPSTQILFVDASDIIIGTGYGLITDIDSSYSFATDTTFVRALQTTDIAMAYGASVSCLSGIDWSTSLF